NPAILAGALRSQAIDHPGCTHFFACEIPPRLSVSNTEMDDGLRAKCACQNCGIHLEFSRDDAGTEIDCPQCKRATVLTLPEDYQGAPEQETRNSNEGSGFADLVTNFNGEA